MMCFSTVFSETRKRAATSFCGKVVHASHPDGFPAFGRQAIDRFRQTSQILLRRSPVLRGNVHQDV